MSAAGLLPLALQSLALHTHTSKQRIQVGGGSERGRRGAMALRYAAAQAATVLRLRVSPAAAVSRSVVLPLIRRFASDASDEVLDGLHYSDSHEWVKIEGDVGTIGISDHAQKALGDLVFVELPEEGTSVQLGEKFGSVESVKAVSDVNSPISGTVVETNSALGDSPQTVNTSPYDAGWLIKVKVSNKGELDSMMTPEKYKEYQNGH